MRSWTWKAGLASMALLSLVAPIGAQGSNRYLNKPDDVEMRLPWLLPTPPDDVEVRLPWLVTDLSDVTQIHFQKVEPIRDPLLIIENLSPPEQQALQKTRDEVLECIQKTVAKINKANETERDHFMKVLVLARSDLAGLPWAMGDECRTNKDRSVAMVREVVTVRNALRAANAAAKIDAFPWNRYDAFAANMNNKKSPGFKSEEIPTARVAALMQILGPASPKVRIELVDRIAAIETPDATHALARLAVFSQESDVLKSARAALKARNKGDYVPILLKAVRYPWPAVADNASAALVELGCKDEVNALVEILDEPDSRAPVVKGRMTVVREVVKLNHHHNCLLCHAPVGKDGLAPTAILQGDVPSPAQPLPSLSAGYSIKKSNIQLAIRVDVTYLRQDFSRLEKVANAAPWPEWQRFDYLVREREVGPREVKAYTMWRADQGAAYLPANHRAALTAVRALTGRDAPATAEAWRKLVGS